MTCREFGPTLEKFCSDPKDFVDPKQIVQMATLLWNQRAGAKEDQGDGCKRREHPAVVASLLRFRSSSATS